MIAIIYAGCGQAPPEPHKPTGDSAIALLAKIDVDLLGPEFRQAVENYGSKKGKYKGLAVISSRGNLVLVSVDLGDRTERALASMYLAGESGESHYWKIEDLNDSNRSMLVLFKDEGDSGVRSQEE